MDRIPKSAEEAISEAISLSGESRYSDAQQVLTTALNHLGPKPEILRWQGNLLEEEALSAINESQQISEDTRSKLARARLCYERALELNPEDAECLQDLAEASARAGMLGAALEDFERALQAAAVVASDDTLRDIFESMATTLVEAGLTDRASLVLRRGLASFPSSTVLDQLAKRLGVRSR